MSKKTELFEKNGTVKYVISKLNGIPKHKKKVEKLESCKDLDSAYTVALRYGRKYIHMDDKDKRDEFFKEAYWLGRKLLREGKKEEINVKEEGKEICIDEEFVNEIKKVDSDYEKVTDVEVKNEIDDDELIRRVIEYGATKLDYNFLVESKVDFKMLGYKEDIALCYLREFDKIVELINK